MKRMLCTPLAVVLSMFPRIVMLVSAVTERDNLDVPQKIQTKSIRLFGKDIVVHNDKTSLPEKGSKRQREEETASTWSFASKPRSKGLQRPSEEMARATKDGYSEKKLKKLKFTYNKDAPPTAEQLQSITDPMERARAGAPHASREVKVFNRHTKKTFWRKTKLSNLQYVDQEMKRTREKSRARKSRRVIQGSETTIISTKSLSSRRQRELDLHARAREAGNKILQVKGAGGHLKDDPLGRTGNEYLRDFRIRKNANAKRNYQRLKENQKNPINL